MKVLNKQKLEKEIRSLFSRLSSEGQDALTEDNFSKSLTRIFENNEFAQNVKGKRMVSILIADLRGFTTFAEKAGPEKIIEILNKFFGTMVEIIDNHGGVVDKFMGDSIIAFFECGEDVHQSVLNVLQCAIEMQIAMDQVNVKAAQMGLDSLFMGIGINTGEVVASVLGSEIYREYTVIGTNVNIASRIEAYTLRGQILLSEQTWGFVSSNIETGLINEVNAKGMQGPLRFFELKAINNPQRLELPVRENRKALRIPVRIPVTFQLLEGKNILSDIYGGEVVDISYGGMLINTSKDIKQFADIKMRVNLSPFKTDMVDLYAKAMYVQSKDQEYEVGLEFTIIDDTTSASIKNFVDNLI